MRAYRVFVADASPSSARAVELALPAPEFDVRTFDDGLAAIEAVRERLPDVLLTAFSLPSRDGYELGSFVRSQSGGGQVALFFLRGIFEAFDMPRIARVAYDGIVQKPFDGESLASIVREAIGQKREMVFLPEEPAIEPPAQTLPPPSVPAPAVRPAADVPGDLEAKIRAIVRAEIRDRREELSEAASEIVAAEVRRVLVEELKKIDTRKI
jgi:DNA-binding response OmpR family regulator